MNNTFREDLYYRLNRLPIFIPSVKERLNDLPDLIQHIIQKINQDYGRNVQTISKEALNKLKQYHWPGNVRELENVIGRAMIFMDMNEEVIDKKYIPTLQALSLPAKSSIDERIKGESTLQDAINQFEKAYISKTYEQNEFNKTKTAKALNVSIRNLYYKMKKYNLE